jgi:hypothetical protein
MHAGYCMMKNILKAALGYFAIIIAIGFVLGTLRVMLLVPRIGHVAAVMIELPIILTASWLVCRALVKCWQVPPDSGSRILMGCTAFLLLMAAEFILAAALFGRSPEAFLADLCTAPGALGLAGQIFFGLWPWIQGIIGRHQNQP